MHAFRLFYNVHCSKSHILLAMLCYHSSTFKSCKLKEKSLHINTLQRFQTHLWLQDKFNVFKMIWKAFLHSIFYVPLKSFPATPVISTLWHPYPIFITYKMYFPVASLHYFAHVNFFEIVSELIIFLLKTQNRDYCLPIDSQLGFFIYPSLDYFVLKVSVAFYEFLYHLSTTIYVLDPMIHLIFWRTNILVLFLQNQQLQKEVC